MTLSIVLLMKMLDKSLGLTEEVKASPHLVGINGRSGEVLWTQQSSMFFFFYFVLFIRLFV